MVTRADRMHSHIALGTFSRLHLSSSGLHLLASPGFAAYLAYQGLIRLRSMSYLLLASAIVLETVASTLNYALRNLYKGSKAEIQCLLIR